MEWVLHGDNKPADPEENTYPLPHNAYSQRPLTNKEQQNQSENNSSDDSTNNKSTDQNTSTTSTDESQNKSTNQSSQLSQADTKNANTRTNASITESEIDAFFNK